MKQSKSTNLEAQKSFFNTAPNCSAFFVTHYLLKVAPPSLFHYFSQKMYKFMTISNATTDIINDELKYSKIVFNIQLVRKSDHPEVFLKRLKFN